MCCGSNATHNNTKNYYEYILAQKADHSKCKMHVQLYAPYTELIVMAAWIIMPLMLIGKNMALFCFQSLIVCDF
jgi:hypothetical protein